MDDLAMRYAIEAADGPDITAAPPLCPCCGQPVDPLDLLIDPQSGRVTRGGREVWFPKGEMAIFRHLLAVRPVMMSKDRLHDLLYGERLDGGPVSKIIDVYLCKMRGKLAAIGLAIESQWGIGVRLVDISSGGAAGLTAMRREVRIAGTRYDDDVRRMLAAGDTRGAIARRLGLSYRATEVIIDRVRAS